LIENEGTEKMGVADFMYETGSLQTETVVHCKPKQL
jgi:hypothetical protein